MKKKKILITFCEAGQGHIVTAQAISEAIKKKYSKYIDVKDFYFKESKNKDLLKYEDFAIKEVKKANKFKLHLRIQLVAMKIFGEKLSLKFSFSTVFKKFKKSLMNIYEKENPDMIISTYFAPYHIACCCKEEKKIKSIIVAYDPDHNVHGWWDRRGDLFITNNKEATREAIEDKKFLENKVRTVNFISRKQIVDCNESKEFYRKKHNIPLNKFTVILADGAYAAAKLESFTDELLKTDKEITIIPVCGKNEKLLIKYNEIAKQCKKNITLLPQPFLKNIEEFYKASDLFVTKAGPNAITDSVFMNTPILINYYSGKIEETSCKLFVDILKTGVYCPDKVKARKMIEEYIENPNMLSSFIKNTFKIDKNQNGADEIADIIAERLGVKENE